MKKYIIIGSIIIILLVGGFFTWHYLRVKNAKIEIVLKDDLDIEFLSDAKVSDFIESINGKIIDDKKIDTTKVGTQEVVFKFINEDNIELESSYKINVVDVTPPLVWLNSTYNVNVGSEDTLVDDILCSESVRQL